MPCESSQTASAPRAPRNRRATVRQADLARLLKAVKNAGEEIGGVEMKPDGTVVVLTGKAPETLSPLERWRLENDASAA